MIIYNNKNLNISIGQIREYKEAIHKRKITNVWYKIEKCSVLLENKNKCKSRWDTIVTYLTKIQIKTVHNVGYGGHCS